MEQKYIKLSFGEELANSITHGVMMLFILISMPFVAINTYLNGSFVDVIGVVIFHVSIFMMFMASMLYHAMAPNSRHKKVFKILDHIFIYVAIAGSYTPIALSIIGGWQGILIVVIQWLMVLFGILYKSLVRAHMPKVSLTIYLIMGWTVVFFFPAFLANASAYFLILIVIGGIFYSIGAFFYAMKAFKYHHMVWHLFVNFGVLAHFMAIANFLK